MREITFKELPKFVSLIYDEVMILKAMVADQKKSQSQQKSENRHKPITPEQASAYTHIPLGTIYQKLSRGEIPGVKPGKRWVLYQDELDKWLETKRKNDIPVTDDEINSSIMNSHRRKPKR